MRYLALLTVLVAACGHPVAVPQPEPVPLAEAEVVSPPQARTIIVAAKKGRAHANIRMFADGKSAVIARVSPGTGLKTFGRDGTWYQVQVPATGALGWIHSVYVE